MGNILKVTWPLKSWVHLTRTKSIIGTLGLTSIWNRLLSRKPNIIHVQRHSSNRSNGHSRGSQLDIKENREEWQNQVLTSWEVHKKRQPSCGYQKKVTVLSGDFRLQRAVHTHRERPYNPMYGTAPVTMAVCPTHKCTCTVSSGSSPVIWAVHGWNNKQTHSNDIVATYRFLKGRKISNRHASSENYPLCRWKMERAFYTDMTCFSLS